MAKIPEFENRARIDVPGAPNLPASPRVPAIGAGKAAGQEYAARQLQNFGGAVQGLGADVTAYQEQQAAEADDMWLAQARAQTTLDWPTQEAQLAADSVAKPAMGVGGAGVVPASKPKPLLDRTKASLDTYSKNVLAKAPSKRAGAAYQQWFAGFGADAQHKAITAELQRQESQKNADFITALDTHTRLVSTDPGAFDDAWRAVEHDLQTASAWADPSKLATLRAKTRADMELARASNLARNDPLGFQREVLPQKYDVAGGSGRLSKGYADNPYYSHVTPEQIDQLSRGVSVEIRNRAISSVIAQEQVQKKEASQSAANLNEIVRQSVRSVSADPAKFDEVWARIDRELQSAANWADADKLAKVRADTRQDLELARAKALTPGQLQSEVTPQQYDAASGTGTPSTGWADNPYYSHLDGMQVAALQHDANSAVVAQHNAAVAQQKAVYEVRFNDLMVSLLRGGKGGLSDVMEARKTWLTDADDIKKANNAIDERDKQSQGLAEAQARYASGDTFNAAIEKDKKDVDLIAGAGIDVGALLGADHGAGISAHGQGAADPQAVAQANLFALTEHTGILPQVAADEIRRGLVSQNPKEMMEAYSLWNSLVLDKGTAAATAGAFTESEMKKLDQYHALAPLLPPDKLVEQMNPHVDRATAQRRAESSAEFKKTLDAEVTKGNDYLPSILDALDPAGSFNYPSMPDNANTVQALRDDYEEAAQYMAQFTTDPVQIKARALEIVKRHWGTTEVGSGVTVIQYPPERSFPVIGDSRDWMDQQMEDMAKASYPGAQDWVPITLPETEGAVGVKVTPRWGIGVHDQNGVWHVLTPPPDGMPGWPFDYRAAYMQAAQEFQDARGSLLDVQPPSPVGPKFNDIMNLMDRRAGRVPGSPMAREAGRPRARTQASDEPFPPAKHQDTPSEKFLKSIGGGVL